MADPNNIILPEYQLAFMCVPKNANTSLKRALITAMGMDLRNEHDPTAFIYTNKHYVNACKNKGWLVVGIKRNPYDRLASCWRQKVSRMDDLHRCLRRFQAIRWRQPFGEFVDAVCSIPDWQADQHFRSQHWDLCIEDRPVPNVLMNMDNLKTEWAKTRQRIKDHCGLEMPEALGREKATDRRNQPYTPELKDRVWSRFKKDFLLLGYKK